MNTPKHPAFQAWLDAQQEIRAAEFPRLTVEDVTDDGETFEALRCPVCGNLVNSDDLYAVDFSERWSSAYEVEDEDFQHGEVQFSFDGDNDYGSTVFYMHDDHPVALPESWKEVAL